ncbi:MAG: YebC/PmpR family DNA-binding transcriptional regulator [Rubricoccaceae bacterium]|nr:YebC/PmpR family DNA-binding transcriptional regulator [Rubricoccaceae bacterium]
MAGHNKWSKIKRKKGAADARRSKIWARITRDIMVAAREGGGNADMNPRLALAIEKGKAENLPKDNIERAIKRGTGEIEGADYEEVTYEGYAPHGIAVFIETLTDNTNRTVADLRSIFSKAGGNLGTSGSVAYLFDQKGLFEIPAEGLSEEDLFMLVADAGADDLRKEDDFYVVETPVDSFGAVQSALSEAGIEPEEAGLQRIPTTTTKLDSDTAAKVLKLMGTIDEHQDVQAVYSTLEIDDATLAEIANG